MKKAYSSEERFEALKLANEIGWSTFPTIGDNGLSSCSVAFLVSVNRVIISIYGFRINRISMQIFWRKSMNY